MKFTYALLPLMIAIVVTPCAAQQATHEQFDEFCEAIGGRWVGEIVLVRDWPAFGKKDDQVVDHFESRTLNDGHLLIGSFQGGQGTVTWVTSAGRFESSILSKENGQWVERVSGAMPDGTPVRENRTLEISADGNTHTWTGDVTVGDETIHYADVWQRVHK